jgi:hypothetical protein
VNSNIYGLDKKSKSSRTYKNANASDEFKYFDFLNSDVVINVMTTSPASLWSPSSSLMMESQENLQTRLISY